MIDLKSILRQYPNCLNSRASFKSVLMDKYPSEKRTVNILTILFECGIANKIKTKKSIDVNEMHRLLAQVENEYGISGQYAQDAIIVWAAALDVTVSAVKVKPTEDAAQQPSKPAVNKPVVYVQGNVDDYEVVKRPDGYYITRFNGFEEEEMTIPSMIDGKKVKGIAKSAFKGCITVKIIHISEGIEIIENNAFAECKALENVVLPDTLRQIGSKPIEYGTAASFCKFDFKSLNCYTGVFFRAGLRTITLPKNVEFLGSYSFQSCANLRKIDLSDKITTIREGTFYDCKDLSEIKLPNNLMTIEEAAFKNCSSLREVHIPVGTQKIGKDAFDGTQLIAIYIPPTVTEIGDTRSLFDKLNDSTSSILQDQAFGLFPRNLTIYCVAGSAAMEYARKNNIKCAKAQF